MKIAITFMRKRCNGVLTKLYSQTMIEQTQWVVRKGFLLSIVSFISCPINVESLTYVKSEECVRPTFRSVSQMLF